MFVKIGHNLHFFRKLNFLKKIKHLLKELFHDNVVFGDVSFR